MFLLFFWLLNAGVHACDRIVMTDHTSPLLLPLNDLFLRTPSDFNGRPAYGDRSTNTTFMFFCSPDYWVVGTYVLADLITYKDNTDPPIPIFPSGAFCTESPLLYFKSNATVPTAGHGKRWLGKTTTTKTSPTGPRVDVFPYVACDAFPLPCPCVRVQGAVSREKYNGVYYGEASRRKSGMVVYRRHNGGTKTDLLQPAYNLSYSPSLHSWAVSYGNDIVVIRQKVRTLGPDTPTAYNATRDFLEENSDGGAASYVQRQGMSFVCEKHRRCGTVTTSVSETLTKPIPDLRGYWSGPTVVNQSGAYLTLTSSVVGLSGTGEIDASMRTVTITLGAGTVTHTGTIAEDGERPRLIVFPSFTMEWLKWWAMTTQNVTFIDDMLRPWYPWSVPYIANISSQRYQFGSKFTTPVNWSSSTVTSPLPRWQDTVFRTTIEGVVETQSFLFQADTPPGTYRVAAMFTEKYQCTPIMFPRCLMLGINGQRFQNFITERCEAGMVLTVSNFQTTGDTLVSISPGVNADCHIDAKHAPLISAIVIEPFEVPPGIWACANESVDMRVGCSCEAPDSPEGSWCGYRSQCYMGECIPCAEGWSRYGASCYLYVRKPGLSFVEAERKCRTLDGALVTLSSANQSAFVSELIIQGDGSPTGAPVWTGGYFDIDSYRQWKWTSGQVMFPSVLRWGVGKPSGADSPTNVIRCLQIVNLNRYVVEDGDCGRAGGSFVCMTTQCLRLDAIAPTLGVNIRISNINQTFPTCAGGACYNNSIQTFGNSAATFPIPTGFPKLRGCMIRTKQEERYPCGEGVEATVHVNKQIVWYQLMSAYGTDASCYSLELSDGVSLGLVTGMVSSVECDDFAWINARVCRSVTQLKPCGKNWVSFRNVKCAKHFTEKVSAKAALALCRSEGGTLLSIESEQENNFAMSLVLETTVGAWVGAQVSAPGQLPYAWTSQKPMGYTAWASGFTPAEPDPNNGCGYFLNKKWRTAKCETAFTVLCQKVGSGTPSLSFSKKTNSFELFTRSDTNTPTASVSDSRSRVPTPTATKYNPYTGTATPSSTKLWTEPEPSFIDTLSASLSHDRTSSPTQTNELSDDRTIISPTKSMTLSDTVTFTESSTDSDSRTEEASKTATESAPLSLSLTPTATQTISPHPGYVYWLPYDKRQLTSLRLSTVGFTITARIEHDTFYADTIVAVNFNVYSDNPDSRGVGWFCRPNTNPLDPETLSGFHEGCVIKFKTWDPNRTSVATYPQREVDVIIGPDYTFRAFNPETVFFTFLNKSVRVGLYPNSQPLNFTVLPETACDDVCRGIEWFTLLGTIAGLTRLSFGASLSMSMQLPVLSALASFRCYSGEAIPLDYLVHPLQFPVGATRLRYYHGAAIGNFFLMVLFLSVHFCVVMYKVKKTGSSWTDAMAVCQFPALSLVPVMLLFTGFNVGACKVAAYGQGFTKFYGVCFVLLVDLGGGYMLCRYFWLEFKAHCDPVKYKDKTEFGVYWFAPRGVWRDHDSQFAFHPKWKYMYNDYKADSAHWHLIEMMFTFLFAACSSIDGKTVEACNIKTMTIEIVAATYFLFLAYVRPFNVRAYNVLNILMATAFVTAFGIFVVVNIARERMQDTLQYTNIILLIASLIYLFVFVTLNVRYLYQRSTGKVGRFSTMRKEQRSVAAAARQPSHHMHLADTKTASQVDVQMEAIHDRDDSAKNVGFEHEMLEPRPAVGRRRVIADPHRWNDAWGPSQAQEAGNIKDPLEDHILHPLDIWDAIQRNLEAIQQRDPAPRGIPLPPVRRTLPASMYQDMMNVL